MPNLCSISVLRLGEKNLDNNDDNFGGVTRFVKRSIYHPKWNTKRIQLYYDVGIWEFEPVEFGPYISPICLPTSSSSDSDKYKSYFATLAGKT